MLSVDAPQIIEATTTATDEKPAFEAEFSPDLSHPNVVQTYKSRSLPTTVRARLRCFVPCACQSF